MSARKIHEKIIGQRILRFQFLLPLYKTAHICTDAKDCKTFAFVREILFLLPLTDSKNQKKQGKTSFFPAGFKKQDPHSQEWGSSGEPPGIRTPDPLIKSQMLCQLS